MKKYKHLHKLIKKNIIRQISQFINNIIFPNKKSYMITSKNIEDISLYNNPQQHHTNQPNIHHIWKTNINYLKGFFFFYIHYLFGFLILFITMFSNSIHHLLILLFIISIDAFSIVVLHQCPLTLLEKKYLGFSSFSLKNKFLKSLNICYTCNHTYENQIELLIVIWSIISMKILTIIFLHTFKINLINHNNIYN